MIGRKERNWAKEMVIEPFHAISVYTIRPARICSWRCASSW